MIAVRFDLKINGVAVPVENDMDLAWLEDYVRACRELFRLAPVPVVANTTPSVTKALVKENSAKNFVNPPVGKRTIDYAHRFAYARGAKPFNTRELFEGMQGFGWNSSSPNIISILRTLLKENKTAFSRDGDGNWVYDASELLPHLKEELASSGTNLNGHRPELALQT